MRVLHYYSSGIFHIFGMIYEKSGYCMGDIDGCSCNSYCCICCDKENFNSIRSSICLNSEDF